MWVRAAMVLPAALLLSASARAEVTLGATGRLTLGYTDNLFNGRTRPAPGEPGRISAWYLDLEPGLNLNYETIRGRHLLGYSHGYTLYFGHPGADTHSDTARAESTLPLSPQDELTLGVVASRWSTALVGSRRDYGRVGQLEPGGRMTVVTIDVAQGLRHDFTARWRGWQRTSFGLAKPIQTPQPEPWRYSVAALLGAEYRLPRDSWELDLDAVYFETLPAAGNRTNLDRSRYLAAGPTLRWRRELDPEWSSELHAGLRASYWFGPGSSLGWLPAWGGSLAWQRELAGVSVSYQGDATPNLLMNQIYYSDRVEVSGRAPIRRRLPWVVFSAHGVASNRVVAVSGRVSGEHAYAWWSEAGLGYYPELGIEATLSYQHFEQFGSSRPSTVLPEFYRNQVIMAVRGALPLYRQGGSRVSQWGPGGAP